MITANCNRMGRMRTGAALLFVLLAACSSPDANAQGKDAAWAGLKDRTAWIILGDVAVTDGTWATLPSYQILGQSFIGHPRTPEVGDVLEITHDSPLYIRDFRNSGESRRLEWPGGRQLREADLTRGVIKAGTRVVVKEVRRDTGSTCDSLCTVWGRVSPEQFK